MRAIIFIFLFMFLCGPRLNFPDLNLLFTLLLSMLSPFYLYKNSYVSKNNAFLILLILISLFCSMVTVIINDDNEYVPIINSLNSLLSFFAAYSVVNMYQLHGYDGYYVEKITYDIQISYLVNCIFVVLVMLSEPLRYFATTLLSQNEKMAELADQSIRSVDLVMGGGAVASIVFSVAFMLSLFVFLQKKDLFSLTCLLFSVLAVTFTGRTGLAFILLLTYPMILLFNYATNRRFDVLKVTVLFLMIFFFTVLLLFFIYAVMDFISPELLDLMYEKTFPWAFEPYLNFINSGEFTSESTYSLMTMYKDGVGMFDVLSLFGTSSSGRNPENYLYTDVGYIRIVYTSGIIGALAIFSKYVYLLINNYHALLHGFVKKSYIPIMLASFYYLTVIFVSNFKEYHDAIRSGFPLLMIFANLMFHHSEKKLENDVVFK